MGKDLARDWAHVEIRLTVRLPRRTLDSKWTYTLVETAQEEAGFLTMA